MPMTETEKEACKAESDRCGMTPCYEHVPDCKVCPVCAAKVEALNAHNQN